MQQVGAAHNIQCIRPCKRLKIDQVYIEVYTFHPIDLIPVACTRRALKNSTRELMSHAHLN